MRVIWASVHPLGFYFVLHITIYCGILFKIQSWWKQHNPLYIWDQKCTIWTLRRVFKIFVDVVVMATPHSHTFFIILLRLFNSFISVRWRNIGSKKSFCNITTRGSCWSKYVKASFAFYLHTNEQFIFLCKCACRWI